MATDPTPLALLIATLAGCAPSPLPVTVEGGVASDLGAVDQRLGCHESAAVVGRWLDEHRGCVADQDCAFVTTQCGLPGGCGTYVNRLGAGGPLPQWLVEWGAGCGALIDCAPCPPAPRPPPACVAGTCGPRAALGSGEVGEGCQVGGDCQTGECASLGGSKLFLGGYCTIIDCNLKNIACPAASTCKSAGDGHWYCFKDCNPVLSRTQCRNPEGYACCPGRGPELKLGWCAPQASALCGG